MNLQVLNPLLRFPDYLDGWEKRFLGEIADITKLAGFEFTKHVIYSDSGKIIGLRAINIKNNRLDLAEVHYLDKSDFLNFLEASYL